MTNARYLRVLHDELAKRLDYFPHDDESGRRLKFLAHQRETNRKMLFGLEQQCRDRLSVVLPCGTGKTEVGLNLIGASQAAKKKLGRNGERKDLFITTEFFNADGAYERAKDFGFDVGKWFGGKRNLDHPVVVATIQALQMSLSRRDIRRILPPGTLDVCVFDEGDQHLTRNREKVREKLDPLLQLALTATPQWPDGRSIEHDDHFGPAVHKMGLKEGILTGINAVPDVYFYEAEIPEDELRISKGDYLDETLEAAWKHAELHLAIPKAYRKIVKRGQRKRTPTLIYVPSVNMVNATWESMMEEFGDEIEVRGLAGQQITGAQQHEFIEGFRNGEIHVGILCERGGRSMNLENAALLIDAFPTLSLTKLTQRHGRVMRKIHPGSELWERGCRKEQAMIVQIIPKAYKRRPALFTDILGGYQEFKRIREKLHHKGGGAPPEDIVDELRRNIEAGAPDHRLHLVKQINALEAIERFDELLQEDKTGFFFRIPPRYGPPSTR